MNKELIKKYKTEFDHWLNGGKILMHYGKWIPVTLDAKWEFFMSDLEKMRSFGYIIDDEYVEFRKALAEGKTIEVLHYTWYKELDQNPWRLFAIGLNNFDKPAESYRIKPGKPQFKVGDWVRNNSSNTVFIYTNDMLKPDPSCCELWKPQPGEYIWDKHYGFCKVTTNCVTNEIGTTLNCIDVFKIGSPEFTTMLEYCQPFIGQLPISLKDQ